MLNSVGLLEQVEAITAGNWLSYIGIGAVALLIVLAVLTVAIRLRGEGMGLQMLCMRDVFTACALCLTLLGAPAAFYFMGRAFWRAATWSTNHEQSA